MRIIFPSLIISILLAILIFGRFNYLSFLLLLIIFFVIYFLYKKSKSSDNRTIWRIVTYSVIFFIIFFILNVVGLFASLNQPLNDLIAGQPNTSCQVDTDCKIKTTSCGPSCGGDSYSAVNKNWQAFCPFRNAVLYNCIGPTRPKNAKCINNTCQLVWQNEAGDILDCNYACYKAGRGFFGNCLTQQERDLLRNNYISIGQCENKEEQCFCRN